MPVITLLTDFGHQDTFVGVMKGVMLARCPDVMLVDLCHTVPPQDVALGAFMLADAFPSFPDGTVHVAVVDPGVGTSRVGMAVAVSGQFLVGPDNGLFSRVLHQRTVEACVSLDNPAFHQHPVSSTFHGRDIFSPVAAALARGTALTALGSAHRPAATLAWPQPVQTPRRIETRVLHVDVFGNVLVALDNGVLDSWLQDPAALRVACGSLTWSGLQHTFGDVMPGAPVAYQGSSGVLELAVRNGNAAVLGGITRGAPVVITRT